MASQREELRARMPGTPGDVVNFFVDVASEVRNSLAQMGYTSLDDVIGRSDLLRQASAPLPKTAALDLGFLVGHVPSTSKSTDRRSQVRAFHTTGSARAISAIGFRHFRQSDL